MFLSKYLLVIFLIISASMFGAVLNASEQVLATITTDIGSDRYQFIVEVDEERRLLRTFLMENLTVGESHSREAIPIESFLSGGLVLPQNGNIVFAKINGHHFDRVLGGGIVIDVLHNGITGKRKYYELELAQEQSGWKLFYKGKSITSIKAIANKIPLFGVVGARELLIL